MSGVMAKAGSLCGDVEVAAPIASGPAKGKKERRPGLLRSASPEAEARD